MTTDPELAQSEEASVRHRGVLLAKSIWRNVRFVHEKPNANLMGHPLAGETVVVCGAGPSLTKQLPLLREAQDWTRIFAVNTAAHALVAAGVRPDVVVAVESVDVGSHIPDDLPVLCALASHERIWNRATWWTTESSAAMARLCRFWRTRPTIMGVGAALGTAIEQAFMWGAREVVLVGCDLAIERGQRVYAEGVPDSHSRITADVEDCGPTWGNRVVYGNHEGRERDFANAGVMAPSAMRSTPKTHEGWHGGEVITPIEFHNQIVYLEARAASLRGNRTIINATEGGARIRGTSRGVLSELLDVAMDDGPKQSTALDRAAARAFVTVDDAAAAVTDVLDQCKRAYVYTDKMAHGQWCPMPALSFFPAVYELAYPGLLGVNDRLQAIAERGESLPDAVALGALNQALRGAAAQLALYLTTGEWERR